MSTPNSTDTILIERGNIVYKVTHEDYYNQIANVSDGGATYGIAFQACHGQVAAGWNASGQDQYTPSLGGSMYGARTDGSGAFTLTSTASAHYANRRINMGFKAGASWYTIGTGTNASSTSQASPMNIYYRRSVTSWAFTPDELTAALGGISATITAVRLQCYSPPGSSWNIWPNYTFGYKLVANAAKSGTNYSGSNGGSYTQVYAANPKSPAWVSGWNELNLTSNISWS